jgi:hypothetical protein
LNEFHPNELDPFLLFDARDSMIGTLENPTLDLDPSKPDTLNVITATRAGTATYTDVNGLIAQAPANTVRVDQTQGAELTPTKFQNIGYTDFSTSLWVKVNSTLTTNDSTAPDGTQTAAKYVGSGTVQDLYYDIDLSGPLTFSFFVKYINAPYIRLRTASVSTWFNLTTGSVGVTSHDSAAIQDVGDGWFRLSVTTTSTSSFSHFYIHPHATDNTPFEQDGGSFYLWGPQVEEGTTASDFVANTTGSPKFITGPTFGPRVPMILVEPSATNSFLYSQPTSALAFGGGGIRTFDAATAPNGETEAFRITNNGTSGNHNYRATSSITFGSDSMVLSVWAKAGSGGNNYFTWSFQNLGGAVVRAGFKLEGDGETQIITNGNGGHTLQIETYPDGWYRCIIIGNTQSSGTTTQFLYTVSGYTEHSSIAGGSVLLWGFQVESGSVATSYIPTSGSTVTRAKDDLVISGSDFTDFYTQGKGTFYVEFVPGELSASATNTLLEISDGTVNERIISLAYSSFHVYVVDGGVAQATLDGGTYTVGAVNRLAFSYKDNNIQASVNGGSVVSDISASIPTVDRLIIGNETVANTRLLNGHIKRFIYWPYHSDSL